MSRWVRRLRWFLRRDWASQRLLLAAAFWLAVSRAAILVLPHRRLESWFGDREVEPSESVSEADLAYGRRVARTIALVSDHTPWTSDCLPQAMTARRLLRRRCLPSTIYIGAKFHEYDAKLVAHAWCRCGPLVVTGGTRNESFGAVIAYGTRE